MSTFKKFTHKDATCKTEFFAHLISGEQLFCAHYFNKATFAVIPAVILEFF